MAHGQFCCLSEQRYAFKRVTSLCVIFVRHRAHMPRGETVLFIKVSYVRLNPAQWVMS